MIRKLLSIPAKIGENFSKAELNAWLASLDAEINEAGRQGDAFLLELCIAECTAANDDREAEMIRRGIRLGLHLASFYREEYRRAVTRKELKPPKPTVTDEQIREAVNTYSTRAEQSKRLGISVRQIQTRLRKMTS